MQGGIEWCDICFTTAKSQLMTYCSTFI